MPQNPILTQPALVAVPIQQAATTVTYMQPIMIPATVPTQLMVTIAGQPIRRVPCKNKRKKKKGDSNKVMRKFAN